MTLSKQELDGLHPLGVSFFVQQTDGGGVACEGAIREGVYDKQFHVGLIKPKNNTSIGSPSRKW